MSAFVVNKRHIDALVMAGVGDVHAPSYPGDGWITMRWPKQPLVAPHLSPWTELRHENADEVGQMLWRENFKSVEHRYPDCIDELPGPVPTPDWELYTYQRPTRHLSAMEILSALDCYEYQSCEHPEWHESEARAFCDTLRRKMIHALPGYRDAGWEIT